MFSRNEEEEEQSSTPPRTAAGAAVGGADPRTGALGNLDLSVSPSVAMALTEEDLEQVMTNFAKEDSFYGKTMTRIVVEKFLSKWKWYAPRKDIAGAPSLKKAYAYYEHITLPRHFVGQQTADHVMRRCEPGETQPTELYSPWRTPSSTFIEWGIGIDLYFSTLIIMAMVLLVCGLIHLPNLIFYRNEDYSPDGKEGLALSLMGSAICTTREWVACTDCKPDSWDFDEETKQQFAVADDGNGTALVYRNNCDGGQLPQGLVNYITMFFLSGVLLLLSCYLGAREVRFDEDKVTATDYSIVVKNPPKDAYDPDEWRDFFAQFAEKQVTVVTVALNNEKLVRSLMARRIHRNNLRLILQKGTDMDDEDAVRVAVAQLVRERDSEPKGCFARLMNCTVIPILNIFNMFLPAEKLVDKVFMLTNQIRELQQEHYDVTKVFVTFETEEGQRAALEALSIGRFNVLMNNNAACAPGSLFRGTVLNIGEPAEPSAVRWLDLSASTIRKTFVRIMNLWATVGLVALSGFIISAARYNIGVWASGPLVSISNSLIPLVVKILMIFEPHGSEGSFQASLYMKITLFRWVNTAFIVKILTPWTSTLSSGKTDVLPQISAVLWNELYLVPLLKLLDLWGNFKKHFFGPRSRTQEEMNLNFQGTGYNLGERYTDLTKVLFVCFYYSALFPASFFFGAAILIVQYYSDRFCLMRIWARSPFLGSEVARFSRKYFFSAAVLAYAIFSAYAWAGFPYDNLCETDETGANRTYTGVTLGDGTEVGERRVKQEIFFQFCRQSWKGFDGFAFPPTPNQQPADKEWMTGSQDTLSALYGWTAALFLAGYVFLLWGNGIVRWMASWVRGVHVHRGQKQNIDFSSNTEIFAYVPQIKWGGLPFPCLACDIDEVDQNLIGWNDTTHSYDYHNLIFDLPWSGLKRHRIIEGNTRDTTVINQHEAFQDISVHNERTSASGPIFAAIKHYPPEWKRRLAETST